MSTITFQGNPIETIGSLPSVGSQAPDFTLTKGDLSDVSLADFKGKWKILNIVPSLDTGVCAKSAKEFNDEVKNYSNLVVLNISRDLPFAATRFCSAEGVDNIIPLSEMRDQSFGKTYGVTMTTGPLAGIHSRAVVVLDDQDKVVYTEQVPEIAQEPNYVEALKVVKK
ncbi:thiol peroxidase [Spirochaeta cellobiosiphila]|uniref:thiol peroxidase n=1 Tax=Spirochaeta cellobiosiphila TaxID=504483 RepID=UPI0003FB4F62|nr:thiol peroxidase [Spirochaeta cellobiosiphila]